MTRYYGIFDVCVDSRQRDSFRRKKLLLVKRLIDHPGEPWFVKAKKVYESRDDVELRSCLQALRQSEQEENRLRLSHRFETRYFIHETDALGWLKPSRRELFEASQIQ